MLIVSFGTTHLDTLENCISATEQAIGNMFPGCAIYRAFLSNVVRKRLCSKYDLQVDTVEEALERIIQDGYEQAVVQPTLVLGGIEYDLLTQKLDKEKRIRLFLGRPLLSNRKDCEDLAEIIITENPLKEQECLVLMGHGTDHVANEMYEKIQEIFLKKNYACFIATVEGKPTFEDAVDSLKTRTFSRAKLLPLMFVAGDHAKNDMAGEEDSLYTMVKDAGIDAECIIRGLGESKAVRSIYGKRALESMK